MTEPNRLPVRSNKVPEPTAAFWAIKILATTVGETAADLLATSVNLGTQLTSLIMAALFLAVLVVQFRSRRYVPWIYWLTVVLISVVGTLITDNLTDGLGVPLVVSTTVFAVALIATFSVWYAVERTLSIHEIVTRRREAFYWLAILFTFALGTAAGDLLAEQLDLGYLASVGVFAAAIVVVAVAHAALRLNAVVAFWIAYVLTRPLGASLGDLLSQPTDAGGLGLGTVTTSALFLLAIVALVVSLTLARGRSRSLTADVTGRRIGLD
ncbi:COG4705 family protein [Leifsonia aquatica]|uniref:COG4705 family protein n=1 Tax=Leifsonia aquatica TaxID=144185 RepID=UPI00046A0B16|nr:membrane protein [Leifsonia aquatica]